jgi:hypothetical protein
VDHHRAAAQAEVEIPAEHGLAAGEEAGGDLEAGRLDGCEHVPEDARDGGDAHHVVERVLEAGVGGVQPGQLVEGVRGQGFVEAHDAGKGRPAVAGLVV